MTTPSSTRSVPTYEALAADIKAQGITQVFGLMSDDTALFVTTLDAMGVRFYGARHENNAVAMAEGYAAATGQLGIAIIGRGPATANSLHGSVYANRTGSRVLIIYGTIGSPQAPGNNLGPDGKALNAPAVLEAAGITTFIASTSLGAQRCLLDAMRWAAPGRCAALLLPTSVQFGAIVPEASVVVPMLAAPKQAARPAAINAAAAVLAQARKPLFIAGLGAHQAGAKQAIEALADATGAVLATSLKGKDLFHGHPFNVGLIGSYSHGAGRRLMDQADCVVVFGAGLNQRTTSYGTSIPEGVPLIHVDSVRANIGRWYHADVAVVADAKSAAEQLLQAFAQTGPARSAADKPLRTPENSRRLADFDFASEFEAAHTPRTMDPRLLALALDRLLPPERNAIYDSGNFLQVVPYISGHHPQQFKGSHDFSSIGLGFGTAMGYAAGTPGQTTVLFVGDGGFLMNLGELETVVREDIPLVIIVMNDCAYGAELHYLKMRDAPVGKSVFLDVDFAPLAASLGFETATVRTLAELQAIAPMLAKPRGPILIDCKINAAVMAPFLLETVEHERRKR
jgi:acetolactate synthase I/II/III large subunit